MSLLWLWLLLWCRFEPWPRELLKAVGVAKCVGGCGCVCVCVCVYTHTHTYKMGVMTAAHTSQGDCEHDMT